MHFFSGNLTTGTDLVINVDLVKCITKININSYPIYNGKVEGGLSPDASCTFMVYSRDTEVSFLMHVTIKSHNTRTNQLGCSIVCGCLSPRFCTGR